MKAVIDRKSGKAKPRFTISSTLLVDVTAEKANLTHMTSAIRQQWGEDYSIVTNDGIELEDSPVTRGNLLAAE